MPSLENGTHPTEPPAGAHSPRHTGEANASEPDLPTVLRELAWVIHRSAPARSGGPLPTTEIALLKQVLDAPGSTVGDLSAALGVRQPNVSAGVRSLESRGLVRREKGGTDRRITQIVATELGAAEHREIAEAWSEPLRQAFESLNAEEQGVLVNATQVLQTLHAMMKQFA